MTIAAQKVTRTPDDDAIDRHLCRWLCFCHALAIALFRFQFDNWRDTLMMVDCLLKSTPDGIVNR